MLLICQLNTRKYLLTLNFYSIQNRKKVLFLFKIGKKCYFAVPKKSCESASQFSQKSALIVNTDERENQCAVNCIVTFQLYNSYRRPTADRMRECKYFCYFLTLRETS